MQARSIQTLLSQGAAGGVCGTFLLLCVTVLAYPRVDNYIQAAGLPFYLALGAGVGAAAGAVMWTLEAGVGRNWSILSRVAVSTLFKVPLFVFLSSAQKFEQRTLFYRYTAVILFGLSILLFTSSSVRPWRLIARGTFEPLQLKILFSRDSIRISRTTEELRHSFLAGLPLRAASLLGLMISVLLAIVNFSFFWWDLWTYELMQDVNDRLMLVAYFGATVVVSFAVRNKWLVLLMMVLVNVPWVPWMLPNGPSHDAAGATIVVFVFCYSWLLFATGLFCSPAKKGQLRVEYGP